MARADLLKRLFEAFQRRDDEGFRRAANELVDDERKKHHAVLANELQRILANGVRSMEDLRGTKLTFDPLPMDSERRTPLLTVRKPERDLDDLVLDRGVRAVLDRVVEEVRGWEILEANALAPTRRLLLCGPSGCGKTASAEALAAELALPLLYVRFDSVVSSLLGETAANLRKVFDYAARGQWVIFFDEFDAIGRSRDDATEHGEIKRVVNSFLQILDSFAGRSIIVAATNFEQALDPAIWRRFDDVLRLDLPTKEGLRGLITKRLRNLRTTKRQVDGLVIKLAGASYADAERVCLDARKSCALGGSQSLRASDLEAALQRFAYRRSVLKRAAHGDGVPLVDRK